MFHRHLTLHTFYNITIVSTAQTPGVDFPSFSREHAVTDEFLAATWTQACF